MRSQFRSLKSGLTVAAVLIAGCSSGTEPEPVSTGNSLDTVTAGDTIVLRRGQSATLAPGVTITFANVAGDSRCPIDVVCVWAGDAHIRLVASEAGGSRRDIDLHTHAGSGEAVVAGIRIRLIDVQPAPVSNRPIEPDDYSVRLSTSRG